MTSDGTERVSVIRSLAFRRFALWFACAATVLAAVMLALYRQDVRLKRLIVEQEAQHVVAMQRELLQSEFRAVESDLLYLARQEVLARFLGGDAAALPELELEYQSFAMNKKVYDQIRCLDTSGNEVVRVNYRDGVAAVVPPAALQSKGARYYFQQARWLRDGDVFVSPFDLNVEHERIEEPIRPVIRFITPLFDEHGERRGFLVLNYLGSRVLSQLKRVSLGFAGETMLVSADGEYLQAPERGREWGWLLGHRRSFRSDFAEIWATALRSDSGQFRDGDRLFAFSRVALGSRPFASPGAAGDAGPSSVIVLAHVPAAVAAAHARELLRQLLTFGGVAMAIIGLSLSYWARSSAIRRSQDQRIAASESRLRQLSSILLAAQEAERRSISRELHDELGQRVTAITLDLRSLRRSPTNQAASALLDRTIAQTDLLLKSLHEIATRVRPSVLDDLGLLDAVESLIGDYQNRTGVKVDARLSIDAESISPMVGEYAYRILQEALSNVAKHSNAGEASVTIATDRNVLRMTVEDRGTGFDPEAVDGSGRLGILGMRERVELLGGEFALVSSAGRGTALRVAIPLAERAPA